MKHTTLDQGSSNFEAHDIGSWFLSSYLINPDCPVHEKQRSAPKKNRNVNLQKYVYRIYSIVSHGL